MQLLIDKTKLELLLEQKREYIGNKVTADAIIAAISFLLSAFTANYDSILGINGMVVKTVFCFIGICYTLKIIIDLLKWNKNKYDHKKLAKDIISLDMIQHNHSLVVIRDTFKQQAGRFLVYYDERWDCKLFLNFKTVNGDNETAILERVSASLQIPKENISARYLTSRVQEKYSVSHDETRVYNHRLYEVVINRFTDDMKKDDFVINGVHYFWMTISEMQKDSNIMTKNMDVVDFVNETIISRS